MYQIIFESQPERFLKKLDKGDQKRIISKIKLLQNKPELGKPLVGKLTGLWSLRTGDYRTLYKINNNKLLILILKIGHRKNVYK